MNIVRLGFMVCYLGIITLWAKPLYSDALLKKVEETYGPYTLKRFQVLRELMEKHRDDTESVKLETINSFFNKVTYDSDQNIWKQEDYWATPYEFLRMDKGDSEDFVIAKFFTLKEMNVDPQKMFFTYVKSKKLNATYMVLVYYETKKSIPLIIDSLNFKVLPANKRPDLKPIYSFNAASIETTQSNTVKAQQSIKFKALLDAIKQERL